MTAREPKYYVESKANALQIPDLRTAMNVFRLLNVNPRGLGIQTKDDAIRIIMAEIDKGPVVVQITPKPPHGLKKAIEEDRSNKAKLCSKYEAVQKLYQELPASYQRDLKQVFKGIEESFETKKNQINMSECTILVAGETAAGKSSMINLLLGGVNLLPTNQLGCTATICEIRTNNQNKKEAIGIFRSVLTDANKKHKRIPITFDLTTDAGIQQFQKAVTDSDEDGNSPYEKIEVTWPFPMFEEGMVIVDTPGIGGSGNMAKYAEKYLSKSYGFIYVVNSANAGGVQKGRLQNFMRLVINAAGEEGFNSDSTIFVCNRWDMIPHEDREAVKHDTFEKLTRYYTDIKANQVHYMSIAEASKALSYGAVTPEYDQLMTLVEKLLPDSLRSRLNSYYRWLTAVLKRTIYSLKVSKVIAAKSMEKVKEEFKQVNKQIERLEQNSRDSINYLKTNLSRESDVVTERAVKALQSQQMTERLFRWNPNELPCDDRKKVAADALERISNRVALEMNTWERENNIVFGIKDSIINVCKRDFQLMEEQIAKLEGALLDGDTKTVHDLHKSIKKQTPVKHIWKKARENSVDEESDSYKGLGGAISSISTLKPGDKQIKKLFSDYKLRDQGRCLAKMQDATKLFLENIFESKRLREKVHTFFKRFIKGIDAVAKMIPDFLKADLQLMEILKDQMTDTETILELFPRLLHTGICLLGQCDLFFVNYIMNFDFKLSDIVWDPHTAPVGSGSFADVYVADIKDTKKGKLPVALKVCRDPLKETTITDILLEDRTLRELDHPNIVRYYGATYRFRDAQRQRDMQWIMILEVCKYTLKQKWIDPDVNNPGKLPTDSPSQIQAMVSMSDFILQLCSGLRYLHEKGYVHRDLKLENILVTDNNIVKLTDVGLAKPITDIAFSVVGSPVYMAPEVLLQSQNYDSKADIYSLGIILWEMWYGKDAADYIQQQLFGPLEKAIKDGLRPSLRLANKAPDAWMALIEKSWAYEPNDRPSVDVHYKFFETLIQNARRR